MCGRDTVLVGEGSLDVRGVSKTTEISRQRKVLANVSQHELCRLIWNDTFRNDNKLPLHRALFMPACPYRYLNSRYTYGQEHVACEY